MFKLSQFSDFLQAPNKGDLIKKRLQRTSPLLKSTVNEPFIFTEIYNCAKIAKIALESFLIHHPNTTIHIYGTPADFALIPESSNFVFHDLTDQPQILKNFSSGHLGTASLWAKIILERQEKYILHFDSDVIFRAPVFPEIIEKLEAGYSIVGPIRNYQHNPNNRQDVRWLANVSQTVCFGFDREKVTARDYQTLTKMCQGLFNPYGHPVIDFFDPVMFDILRNGGTTYHLSSDDFGGCDLYGKRTNAYPELNARIDFGHKLAHFAAVGSGMNFHNNKATISPTVAQSYIDFAVEKYAIFCKVFYQEELGIPYDPKKYQSLLQVKDWYQGSA